MRKPLLLVAMAVVALAALGQSSSLTVKSFRTDLAFTCITVDSSNGIWAGTSGRGLVKIQYDIPVPIVITNNNFDRVIIRSLAADKSKGIWVAHEGYNSTVATYGGVDFLDRVNPVNRQHYASVSLVTNNNNKGLPTRRTQGIAIDSNGKVWTSHSYHDLTVPGGNPSYLVNPGGLGYKTSTMTVFDTIPNGLEPYPAYTRNTPITESAGTRVCPSVAVSNRLNEVWLGVASYNAFPFQNSRICRWSLGGTFLGEINGSNSPLPLGAANNNARATAIHFDKNNRVWVGFNLGKGFGVKLDTGWAFAGRPNIMPTGAVVNQGAIASNKKGEVFIGTNAGLLKYRGVGAFSSDTSYVLYTTAQGLTSNNITGVTVGLDGAVWLATGAGICKLTESDFAVYNVVHPEIGKELQASKVIIACAKRQNYILDCNLDPLRVNVAADSSRVTLIVYTGDNPASKKLYIEGAPEASGTTYSDDYGQLELLKPRNQITDSLIYIYRHPSYVKNGDNVKFVSYELKLDDTVTMAPIFKADLRIYHPPVLMIHGVWSSTLAFDKMRQYLKTSSNNFEDWQLHQIFYNNPIHIEPAASAVFYKNEVPNGIDYLLQTSAANKLSVGKVDVLGHSRGGIFTRLYAQSSFMPYRNDINKLITLNTPHSGSQTANLVLDKRPLLTIPIITFPPINYTYTVGDLFSHFSLPDTFATVNYTADVNGAVELKVHHPTILNTLNGPAARAKDNVFKHAIGTKFRFGPLLKSDILRPAIVPNTSTMIASPAMMLLKLRIFLLIQGMPNNDGLVDDFLKLIFNGEDNDIVVPFSSQRGGMPDSTFSDFSLLNPGVNIAHSNKDVKGFAAGGNAISVVEKPEVMARVAALLRAKTSFNSSNSSTLKFTKGPFNPPLINYTFLPSLGDPDPPGSNRLQRASSAETDTSLTKIEATVKGSSKMFGDTLRYKTTATTNVKYTLVSYESPSFKEPLSDIRDSAVSNFILPIPKEAAGIITIVAMGFSNTGLVAVDSSYINVGINPATVLDSIRITNKTGLSCYKNDSAFVSITGYYRDTAREISFLPGVTYTFLDGKAAAAKYGFKGITPGYELLVAGYGGKVDSAYIEIKDAIIPPGALPINLLSFSGKFVNKKVQLTWITAQETNNAYFDVYASTDGINFNAIGRLAGAGNSIANTSYEFADATFFKSGKNFYRLRQTDFDGNSTWSKTVLINVAGVGKAGIVVYPNPASDVVNFVLADNTTQMLRIALYDSKGAQVLNKGRAASNGRANMPLPNLPTGTYMLKVYGEDNQLLLADKLSVKQ